MNTNVLWDRCEVRYRVQNVDAAYMVDCCDEFPVGWSVRGVDNSSPRESMLVLEVDGAPTQSDGELVYRILQRLGAL